MVLQQWARFQSKTCFIGYKKRILLSKTNRSVSKGIISVNLSILKITTSVCQWQNVKGQSCLKEIHCSFVQFPSWVAPLDQFQNLTLKDLEQFLPYSPVFMIFYLITDNINCNVSFDPEKPNVSVWLILSPNFHICFLWEWMNWQRQSFIYLLYCLTFFFTKHYPCGLACGNTFILPAGLAISAWMNLYKMYLLFRVLLKFSLLCRGLKCSNFTYTRFCCSCSENEIEL